MDCPSIDILLVEDNSADAEMVLRVFKKNHVTNSLHHVEDGVEALEYIFETGELTNTTSIKVLPRLILLDMQLPKINGLEVLGKIKSNQWTKHVPVIVFIPAGGHPHVKRCFELGADGYVVKPLNFGNFADAIINLGFHWSLLGETARIDNIA